MDQPIDCKPSPCPTSGVSVDQLRRWSRDRHLIERALEKPLTNVIFALSEDRKHERLILFFGPDRIVIESRHARGGESWLIVEEPEA